jgi:hypothetical protein
MKIFYSILLFFGALTLASHSMAQNIVWTQNTSSPAACDGVAYIDSNVFVTNTVWAGNGMIYQQGGTMIDSLCAGTYTLTYNSSNVGSSTTVTFVIGAGSGGNPCSSLTASATTVDASGPTVCDGSAQITASGGTAPYTFTWSNGMMTSSSATNLCPGTYTFCVTDANGCMTCNDAVINDASTNPIDSILIFTNNSYPGSNVSGTLLTTTVEDCNIDFSLVDSAGISNYTYLNQDTVLITWSLYDVAGNVMTSYTLPYAIPNNATGVFSAMLIVFCSQRAANYNTIEITDQVYLNPSIMGITEESSTKFMVVNPFSESLIVTFEDSSKGEIRLFDSNGRCVLESKVDNQTSIELNTTQISSGAYYIQVTVNGSSYAKKLIK